MTRILEIAKTNYSKLLKQIHEAGIEAISEQHWLTLKSTAELILNPKFAVFQVHQHIHQLKQKLPDKSAGFNAAPYREVIHWARLVQPNYREKQAKNIECLNDPLWWHRCVEKVKTLPLAKQEPAMERLNEVQNRWHFQQAYAHYSTLDILHVYQTTLPVFTEWLQYAKTEWQQKADSLLPRLKRFYQNYLTWFEQALLEEKALLRNCLRERLAIGIRKGYGVWDDVIESLREELEGIRILPKSPKENTRLCGYLTPEIFVLIHQVIEQDGSEAEKRALYQLNGDYPHAFDKSATFYQHYRINAEGCCYLIPPARSNMISTELPLYLQLPRFLQQLFWGDVATYTFFQEPTCQFLLVQNKTQLEASIDLSGFELEDIFDHPAWKQSDLCVQLCHSEFERTASWLKSVWLFFFPAVKSLLQGYQTDLKADAENWATKQLLLLKEALKRSAEKPLTPKQQDTLKTACHRLQETHRHWEFSSAFLETLAIKADDPDRLSEANLLPEPSIVVTVPTPSLPARDAFPLALHHVVRLMKQHGSLLPEQLATLEAQLQTDSATYDSIMLRSWLEDYLAHTLELPRHLAASLQAVLDDPKFSETALDRSENQAVRALHKTVIEALTTQATIQPIEEISSLWDKDLWDDNEEIFQAHCQALKNYVAQLPQGLSVTNNEKLCQYTLRCFKHIHDLSHWEAFVLKRERINQLLNTLLEITDPLFALHPILRSVVDTLSVVTARRWKLAKDILLTTEIHTLEHFINRPSNNPAQQEAASYASQIQFQWSRRQEALPINTNNAPHSKNSATKLLLR